MKREGWGRWSLPNPSSCAFPLGSRFVLRGSEKRRKLLVCPAALIRLSLPGGKSVFIGQAGASQGLFSFWPTIVGNSPRNYGWEFISWLRSIWGYTFKGEGGPLAVNPWKKLWVTPYSLWSTIQRNSFLLFWSQRYFQSPQMHYLIYWPKMCVK